MRERPSFKTYVRQYKEAVALWEKEREAEEAKQLEAEQRKAEQPKVGDIVEVRNTRDLTRGNYIWTGLGIVIEQYSDGTLRLFMLSGNYKGHYGGFGPGQVEVVHGYIHVNRTPTYRATY